MHQTRLMRVFLCQKFECDLSRTHWMVPMPLADRICWWVCFLLLGILLPFPSVDGTVAMSMIPPVVEMDYPFPVKPAPLTAEQRASLIAQIKVLLVERQAVLVAH